VRNTDREWRWVRARGSPRYEPSGEVLHWYGSVQDIDAQKQLEEALRKGRA